MSENGYPTVEIRVRAVQAVERGWNVSEAADAFGVSQTADDVSIQQEILDAIEGRLL